MYRLVMHTYETTIDTTAWEDSKATKTLYRNTWKYQLKVSIVKVKYPTQNNMLSSLKPKSVDGPVAQREITVYVSPPTKLAPHRMPDV